MVRFLIILLTTFAIVISMQEQRVNFSSPSDKKEYSYPEHLTGAFTGGFGEETCRSFHFDYDLNPDSGGLQITGIPAELEEGTIIEISIMVEREELGRAGFQMTARFENGRQAGRFIIAGNDRLAFTPEAGADSLQYVQHSAKGSKVGKGNTIEWKVKWKVPDNILKPIIFNFSANAANGDQSEFGDYIYSRKIERRY